MLTGNQSVKATGFNEPLLKCPSLPQQVVYHFPLPLNIPSLNSFHWKIHIQIPRVKLIQ